MKKNTFTSQDVELMEQLIREADEQISKAKLLNLWSASQGGKDELGSEIAEASIKENNKAIEIVKQKKAFFEDILKKNV